MSMITISLPYDISKITDRYTSVKWEEIAKDSILRYARKLELLEGLVSKGKIKKGDVEEIALSVKESIAAKYQEI